MPSFDLSTGVYITEAFQKQRACIFFPLFGKTLDRRYLKAFWCIHVYYVSMIRTDIVLNF